MPGSAELILAGITISGALASCWFLTWTLTRAFAPWMRATTDWMLAVSDLLREGAKNRGADAEAERLFLLNRIQDLEAKLWTKDPQAYRAMAPPVGRRQKTEQDAPLSLRDSGGIYDPVLGIARKTRRFGAGGADNEQHPG